MMKNCLTALALAMVMFGCEAYTKVRHAPPVCPSKAIPPEKGTDPRCVPEGAVIRPSTQPAGTLTLDDAGRLALEGNGRLRIADRRVLVARDQVREAWAIDLPKLSAQGRFDIREKSNITVNSAAARAAGLNLAPQVVSVDRDVSSASLNLLVPIYDFGYGYHQREAARIGVDVAELTSERARQDLIYSVKQAYFRVLEAQKIKGVVLESIQTVNRQLEIARDFFGQGLVAKNDVLVVEVQLAERKQQLIQSENNIQLAMATLNRLMDEPVTREFKLVDVLEATPWKGTFESVFFVAIKQRPDLAALRRQIQIVEEQYRATRANLMPRISGYANAGYTDQDKLPGRDRRVGQGGIIADLSIFDGGLTYAQMARLSKEINQAIDAQSEGEKDILLQVKQAYLNLNDAAERIPVAKKSIELAEENLRITRDQYAQGLLTSEEVLLQEERLSRARVSYYQALYAYQQSFAGLANAIGTTPPEINEVSAKASATGPAKSK